MPSLKEEGCDERVKGDRQSLNHRPRGGGGKIIADGAGEIPTPSLFSSLPLELHNFIYAIGGVFNE